MLGNASGEFGMAYSEIDCDHRTRMKFDKVLEHEAFLYGHACVDKFRFHMSLCNCLNWSVDLTILYSHESKESELHFTKFLFFLFLLKLLPFNNHDKLLLKAILH